MMLRLHQQNHQRQHRTMENNVVPRITCLLLFCIHFVFAFNHVQPQHTHRRHFYHNDDDDDIAAVIGSGRQQDVERQVQQEQDLPLFQSLPASNESRIFYIRSGALGNEWITTTNDKSTITDNDLLQPDVNVKRDHHVFDDDNDDDTVFDDFSYNFHLNNKQHFLFNNDNAAKTTKNKHKKFSYRNKINDLIIINDPNVTRSNVRHIASRYRRQHTNNQMSNNNKKKYGRKRKKRLRSVPDLSFINKHHHFHHQTIHWPVKKEAVIEGDIILGGLHMVHEREDSKICGPIMPQGGIQALETMLYTLDYINNSTLLNNFTIGAHVLDDCDKDTYGLEMAVDFIKGSISNIDDTEYHCNKTVVRKIISGVVGAASSVTSIQVANLLRLFRIPQVSFFSTSPELSNKQRFEYFTRTIPSDHYQVKAMVDIVVLLKWNYISIIYEESNYGIKAFEELEDLLSKRGICIAIKEKLVKDSGVAEEIAYDSIVHKLLTKTRARGCIIFGSDQEVAGVMRAVRRANASRTFSWIGSDGWSARNLVSDGNEPEVEGTLSVQPQANPVKGFEEYFLNLNVENNRRNPWFVEFWEDHFQCRYPNSSLTPYNEKYTNICTTHEKLAKNKTDFEAQLQFVSDAVMAFAYALKDMHRELCGGKPGLCDAMKPTKGSDLLKFLKKVQFEGLTGDDFRFDINGDGPARYNIIHFKQIRPGKYDWVKVGEYNEGSLNLDINEVQFKIDHPTPPQSVCSLPCSRGQAKKYVEGESCCWHCFNCTQYQIVNQQDETQCYTCPMGTLPDSLKEYCDPIPEVYMRPQSIWAIGAMSFSATGILITLFVTGVFVKNNETPVVRASGRELSYVLLAGILMCYLITFSLVFRPTDIVCSVQRFSAGLCFTIVYGALFTKTNRIARIFKAAKQTAKRPSFISPRSQLCICSALVFVQILINGIWMIISPAHAVHHYPTREQNLLVCNSYMDASYMIAFFYPIFLIIICTIYAILTRKIPESFNESKHIGFTMYTTCIIWLAFVPLYFATAQHLYLRITSMSVTISLSATVTLACLFTPKLYIILIRPERNVRQSMMPVRLTTFNKSGNDGSMMGPVMLTAATCCQNEKVKTASIDTNKGAENGSVKYVEIGTQTCTVTDFNFTGPIIKTNNKMMSSLASPSSLHNIPYADQSSLPPLTTISTMGTAIEASTNTGVTVVADSINQMVSSTSFNNISGINSGNSVTTANFNSKQQPSEENHNNKIGNKTSAANSLNNDTCVRQRNGNFIS